MMMNRMPVSELEAARRNCGRRDRTGIEISVKLGDSESWIYIHNRIQAVYAK